MSCHKVIIAQHSPLLATLLAPAETTTIVLAEFGKSELHGMMNLLYTGRYEKRSLNNQEFHVFSLGLPLKLQDSFRKF